MHVERTEFLEVLPTPQALMLEYMERTNRDGDLPPYDPPTYDEALEGGRFPSRNSGPEA